MSLISVVTSAWSWFKKNFIDHIQSSAHVAVTITEAIKAILANPITGTLENIADAVTGTQIPTALANVINGAIPKILAVELSIEGLPANATPDQILAFEQAILKAFSVSSNNSKLYTVLSAQIYGIIQSNIANGTTNFAGWVVAIEQIYTDYKLDLSANAPIVAPITQPIAGSPNVAVS